MTGFQWAEALANPTVIGAGCLIGLLLIVGIVRWLYRESDPKGWLHDDLGPAWTVETPLTIGDLLAREADAAQGNQTAAIPLRDLFPPTLSGEARKGFQARTANVVPMRPTQLPRRATK